MTADRYLTYWCSNDAWWDYDENGKPVVLPTAPKEAQQSYQYYMEHRRSGKPTKAVKNISRKGNGGNDIC